MAYGKSNGKSASQPIDRKLEVAKSFGPSQRVGSNSRYKKNLAKEGNLCPDSYSKM